jgi:hypothetical protein
MTDKPSAPSAVVPGDDELNAAFAPYITAAGEVVNAWNKLQEQLNLVFVAVTGMPKDMATAIWHSVRSDRVQRDLLLAAIDAAAKGKWADTRVDRASDDVSALVKHANTLAQDRNNAIHAPVSLSIDDDKKLVPFPVHFHGNRLAKRLLGKNIIVEFNRCRDEAIILKEYAEKIETALNHPSYAWPDRPALLKPPRKKPDKQSRPPSKT